MSLVRRFHCISVDGINTYICIYLKATLVSVHEICNDGSRGSTDTQLTEHQHTLRLLAMLLWIHVHTCDGEGESGGYSVHTGELLFSGKPHTDIMILTGSYPNTDDSKLFFFLKSYTVPHSPFLLIKPTI